MAEKASLSNANNGENLTAEEQLCLRLDEEARYAPYVRSIIVIRETCNFMKIITLFFESHIESKGSYPLSLYFILVFISNDKLVNISHSAAAKRKCVVKSRSSEV